jgi:hypothetical protein
MEAKHSVGYSADGDGGGGGDDDDDEDIIKVVFK